MRPGFLRHRKLLKAARLLCIPKAHALGLVEIIWHYGYETGDDYLGTADDVEMIAEWTGDPGALVKALVGCGSDGPGLLEPVPGRRGHYQIHDFFDHAPDYVRKRRSREEQRHSRGSQTESNAQDAKDDLDNPGQPTGHCPVSDRSLTGQSPDTVRLPGEDGGQRPVSVRLPGGDVRQASGDVRQASGDGRPPVGVPPGGGMGVSSSQPSPGCPIPSHLSETQPNPERESQGDPPPPEGGGSGSRSLSHADRFQAFWKQLPVEMAQSKPKAEAVWVQLSPGDQMLAVARIGPWIEDWTRQKKRHGWDTQVPHAARWLADRRFEDGAVEGIETEAAIERDSLPPDLPPDDDIEEVRDEA